MTIDPLNAWLDTAQADADAAIERQRPDAWADSTSAYTEAGWTPEPDEGDRMFWDAGYTAGARAARTRDPLMVAAIRDVLEHMANIEVIAGHRILRYEAIRNVLSARLLGDDTPNDTKEAGRG